MHRNRFTISEAAHLVNLNAWDLRRLESLGTIPQARRDPVSGRNRLYTAEDVQQIRVALTTAGIVLEEPVRTPA